MLSTQQRNVLNKILSQGDSTDRRKFNSGSMLTIHHVTITPEIAKEILDLFNKNNRRISKDNVAMLKRDMDRGDWRKDSGTVHFIFGKNGILNSGQHICTAVILYGKPIQVSVTLNSSTADRNAIDRNLRRSVKQQMKLDGYSGKDAETCVSLWRDILQQGTVGVYDAEKLIHPTLEKEITFVTSLTAKSKHPVLKNAPFRTASTVICAVGGNKGEKFVKDIIDGNQSNESGWMLREKLIAGGHGSSGYREIKKLLETIFSSWEKFSNGKRIYNKKNVINKMKEILVEKYPQLTIETVKETVKN